jgi:hypothetical protein
LGVSLATSSSHSSRPKAPRAPFLKTLIVADPLAEAIGLSTQRRTALPAIGDLLLAAGGVAAAGVLLGIVAAPARRNRRGDHRAAVREANKKAPAIRAPDPMATEISPR